MRILLLIRSLNRGGAERQLITLAKGLTERGHVCAIVLFYAGGTLEPELAESDVLLLHLGKSGRWDVTGFARQLIQAVRSFKPDVLYSFLNIPNLLAVLLKPWLGAVPVVWSGRVGAIDMKQYDRFQQITYGLEPWLVRGAALTITNSESGRIAAIDRGFPEQKVMVIENGIDTARFAPNAKVRSEMRADWGIDDDDVLIAAVGRLDPMKEYPSFLRAAARVAERHPNARFQIVGDGSNENRTALIQYADRLGIGNRFRLFPGTPQIERVYCALDILVSSSNAEGFSNVVAEAMASGVPCAVTDVGDARRIVGELGEIAHPGQDDSLAAAIERLLPRLSASLSTAVRDQIVQNYSVAHMVNRTERALQQVVDAATAKGLGRA